MWCKQRDNGAEMRRVGGGCWVFMRDGTVFEDDVKGKGMRLLLPSLLKKLSVLVMRLPGNKNHHSLPRAACETGRVFNESSYHQAHSWN